MPPSRVTNIDEVIARLRLIQLRAAIRLIAQGSGHELLPFLHIVDASCKVPGITPDRRVIKLYGVTLPVPVTTRELSVIAQHMIDELQPPTIIDGHWKEE